MSSNYNEPPNRYLSPFRSVNNRSEAFRRAVRAIGSAENNDFNVLEIVPSQFYIHLTVPGTTPGSLDDVELVFVEDTATTSIVNVRCVARVTLPPPPFCVQKNCINGNMDQRERVNRIAQILGLPPSDQDQMRKDAKWTPIFFNSDRVPDFADEDS